MNILDFYANRNVYFDKIVYRNYRTKNGSRLICYNLKQHNVIFLDDITADFFELLSVGSIDDIKEFYIKNGIEDEVDEFIDELFKAHAFNDNVENLVTPTTEQSKSTVEKQFYDEIAESGYLYAMHIDITNRCNLRCVHCYHDFSSENLSMDIQLNDIYKLIDNFEAMGGFHITISGGEPFLHKNIFEILQYISNKNMVIDLYTNATLITEDIISRLKDTNVNKVSISLYSTESNIHDSITQINGSCKKSQEAIDLLIKHGFNVEIKAVMMKNNFSSYSKEMEYAKQKQIPFYIDTSMTVKLNRDRKPLEYGITEDEFNILLSDSNTPYYCDKLIFAKADERPCNAGLYSLYCNQNGDIFPCVSFRIKLGTLNDNLNDVFNCEFLNSWRNTKNSDFKGYAKHSYCKYCLEICAGNALLENDDYLSCEKNDCFKAQAIEKYIQSNGKG